jgi:hypothetical protein
MAGLGRNRSFNKNLTQLNFLTNLTDCCVAINMVVLQMMQLDALDAFMQI